MGTLTTLAPQVCSYSKQEYTGDPFCYVDGHFIGHDGFVVPKDFPEFYERFPQYIRRWVSRHAGACSSKEDIDEWSQDLCAHMSCLPATSNYRKAGKQDVIQTFDPLRHFGATLPRFLNYVNRCLINRFRTIHSNRMKNPVCRADPLSSFDVGGVATADDEPYRASVEGLKATDLRSRKQVEDKLLIGEFVDFIRVENPRLLPVLEAIAVTRTQREAARTLGIPGTDVGRLFRQVRELGRSFLIRTAGRQPSHCEAQCRTETNAFPIETARASSRPIRSFNVGDYWNRVDLYNEVWDKPLIKLSRKYGISDVRLGKVCRKLKIPHPGRGFWARRAVGQAVEQVPLPEFNDAPVVKRLKTKNRTSKITRLKQHLRATHNSTHQPTVQPTTIDLEALYSDFGGSQSL